MDFREEWFIYNNKLINDVNDFGVSIELGASNDSKDKQIYFILNIYSRIEKKRIVCVFETLDDLTYFLNYYLSNCKSILDATTAYKNFTLSDEVIYKKGYVS